MIVGYAVEKYNGDTYYYSDSFFMDEYSFNDLSWLRNKAEKKAREVVGVVVPLGILTEEEMKQELLNG